MKKKIWGGLLAVCVTSSVAAQEVDEIIVSATGIPTPAHEIGASVDVITAADLEAQQITYLQDALGAVAGISTYSSGGPGTTSNVFMRGMTGKYGAAFVDGVQINSPANQQVAWSHLSTHGLDSIEVLRGSQGVLFGSEAIGGVVNLFTAYGGETENRITLEGGSFGTQNISLSSKGQAGRVGYGLFVKQSDIDGFSIGREENGNSEKDGYENLNARGRFVVDLSDQLSVDVALRSVSSEVDTDPGDPPVDGPNYTDFDTVGGRLALTYKTANSVHTLSSGETEDVSTSFSVPFGQTELSGSTTEGLRSTLNYRGVFNLSDQVQLLVGYEDEEDTSITSSDATYEASNQAVMALLQYSDDAGLSASFAMRQDDNEEFGKFDTSRLAAKKMFGQFGVRGSYGTGFRAPSLDELYGESIYCVANTCGNPDLQPEESRGHDIALVFEPNENLNIELAQFKITISDFIKYGNVAPDDASDPCLAAQFWNPSATTCGKYEQTDGESKSNGYELRGAYQVGDATRIGFNFTKLDANDENGQREIRRPEETLNVTLSHGFSERLSVSASVKAVRDVLDSDFSTPFPYVDVELDDYTLLNLSAAYQINEQVKAYGRIENTTDEDYETAYAYSTAGRAFYVGVSSSF